MKKKTTKKQIESGGVTLEEFFLDAAKAVEQVAAQNQDVAQFLVTIVGEVGQLSIELADKINQTLDKIDEEMAGKLPSEATFRAFRLKGEAKAYAFIADRLTAMVKRLEEKDVTIH